jgi:glycosyltransferase involved in cell wall biosynthesis
MPADARILKPARSALKAIEHIKDTLHLAAAVLRLKPDVVHYQWMPIPSIDRYAITQFKKKNIPVFFTVHDTNPFNNAPTMKGQGAGWRKSLDLFDGLIVHTEASKKKLEQYGVASEKIAIVPHGLLAFGPMDTMSLPKKKTILFFGTIKPYKGLDVLLRAFKKIADKIDVQLRIVGSCQNDDIERYRSLIRDLGIGDKVDLDVRYFADAEIPAMLADATLVVFPYRHIDGSGALLTAAVYEKPFIASDIGMFHEMLKGNHLSLVPPDDADALAERLEDVFSDTEKMHTLKNISKHIKSKVPSWSAIGTQTLANYQKYIHATK